MLFSDDFNFFFLHFVLLVKVLKNSRGVLRAFLGFNNICGSMECLNFEIHWVYLGVEGASLFLRLEVCLLGLDLISNHFPLGYEVFRYGLSSRLYHGSGEFVDDWVVGAFLYFGFVSLEFDFVSLNPGSIAQYTNAHDAFPFLSCKDNPKAVYHPHSGPA
jgi:hypothetical protein